MKKQTFIFKALCMFALLTLVWSCGPAARVLEVESSVPALYPVGLENNSVAVFFPVEKLDTHGNYISVNDSLFMAQVAEGIAQEIESQLFLDQGAVFVFSHYPSDREYGLSYIQELSFVSNSDIVILLDSLNISKPMVVQNSGVEYGESYTMNYIYSVVHSLSLVYDGTSGEQLARISKSDSVYWEVLSRNELREEALVLRVLNSLPNVTNMLGNDISKRMFPEWVHQQRNIYVFPNPKWDEAYSFAQQFKWKEAMDIWLGELQSQDKVKVAVAAFNMAVACELTDRVELASEWAELSFKSYVLPGIISYKQYLKEKIEEEQPK